MTAIQEPTTAPATPFAIRPVADHPDISLDRQGNFIEPPDGMTDWFGHCQSFCISDVSPSGASVEEHGDRCVNSARYVKGVSEDGSRFTLAVEVVAPYHHGRYLTEELVPVRDDRMIGFALAGAGVTADATYGSDEKLVQFTVGNARRLMRFLEHATDVADMVIGTEPENLAVGRRRRSS